MTISPVHCTLPFCGNSNQSTASRISRITAVIVGVILLINAIIILSGAMSTVGMIPGWVCFVIGSALAACGSFLKCTDDAIILKQAQQLHLQGERRSAVQLLNEVNHPSPHKEKIFFELAKEAYHSSEPDTVISILNNVQQATQKKEERYLEYAEKYYLKNQLGNAVKMLKNVHQDVENREKFFLVLAAEYCKKNDKAAALEMLKEVRDENQKKQLFINLNNLQI